MMRRWYPIALAALLVLFAGCTSDDNVLAPLPSNTSLVQVVHGSPDAPPVDILVDTVRVIANMAYTGASNYLILSSGSRDVRFNPAGSATPMIDSQINFVSDAAYTLFAANTLGSIEPLLLQDLLPAVSDDSAFVRFVHLSPNVGPVDLTLEDGTVLYGNIPFRGSTSFRGFLGSLYPVQVRLAGTSSILLEDELSVGTGFNYTFWFRGVDSGIGAQALGLSLITHD